MEFLNRILKRTHDMRFSARNTGSKVASLSFIKWQSYVHLEESYVQRGDGKVHCTPTADGVRSSD